MLEGVKRVIGGIYGTEKVVVCGLVLLIGKREL